jgi:hypothetical protein
VLGDQLRDRVERRARVGEAHLELLRVHVHVDDARIEREMERACRETAGRQHAAVGVRDRAGERVIAHWTTIDEQVQAGRAGSRALRRAQGRFDPYAVDSVFEAGQRLADEHALGALPERLGG